VLGITDVVFPNSQMKPRWDSRLEVCPFFNNLYLKPPFFSVDAGQMRSSLAFQLRLQFVITRIISAAALRCPIPSLHPDLRTPAIPSWLHSVRTAGQKTFYISCAFQKSDPLQFSVFVFVSFIYFRIFAMEEKLIRVDLMEILVVIHNLVKR